MNQQNNKPEHKPSGNVNSEISDLILINDDFNTFDLVVETLMKIFDYDETQSEQLAVLAHFKGKTIVRSGKRAELTEAVLQFQKAGLNVEIG